MTAPHSDALVFFGATGDLAYKKIFPSLQAMLKRGHLEAPVIGVATPQLLSASGIVSWFPAQALPLRSLERNLPSIVAVGSARLGSLGVGRVEKLVDST